MILRKRRISHAIALAESYRSRETEHNRIDMSNQKGKLPVRKIAEKLGLHVGTLWKWRAQGVDVWDEKAIEAHRATLMTGGRARPRTPPSADLTAAKLRLTNAQAEIAELAAAKRRGDMVEVSTVREDILRIGSALAAGMARLESDLPPRLEGLDAASMQTAIREAVDGLRSQFADSASALYAAAREDESDLEDLPKPATRKAKKRK